MNSKHRKSNRRKAPARERGAVLILTVVVIMVLTTLGMAMVTFSGTEERSATTYRDSVQVRAVAESGVRIVQQMFQNPDDNALVPQFGVDYEGTDEEEVEESLNEIGIFREERNGATPARYTGGTNRFFRGPFRGSWAGVFGGLYNSDPDVEVHDLQFVGGEDSWLDDNINVLLTSGANWNEQTGRIVNISFYAPPMVAGSAYGICKVRVTAEKRDGNRLIARETVEALIGDNNLSPAMLAEGDISFKNITACGSGCEQIHSNSSVTISSQANISGGNPPISAVGSVDDVGTITPPPLSPAPRVDPPMVNPWDVAYRPTKDVDLSKYYLLSVGPLPGVWTNDVKGDEPANVACGFSFCQDFGLEYTGAVANGARAADDDGYLYKWDKTNEEWDLIDTCESGESLTSNGTETFTVAYTGGADVTVSGAGDTALPPFNKLRRPQAKFSMGGINPANTSADAHGATILVDGNFETTGSVGQGNKPWHVAIIAAGYINTGASADIRPATADRIQLIAGRDIYIKANFNNDIQVCQGGAPTATSAVGQASGIIAAHEQIYVKAQAELMGLIIAEHRAFYEPLVDAVASDPAIKADAQMNHSYVCGFPTWPWTRATRPVILSMNSATN
jgi:hypothetical protein